MHLRWSTVRRHHRMVVAALLRREVLRGTAVHGGQQERGTDCLREVLGSGKDDDNVPKLAFELRHGVGLAANLALSCRVCRPEMRSSILHPAPLCAWHAIASVALPPRLSSVCSRCASRAGQPSSRLAPWCGCRLLGRCEMRAPHGCPLDPRWFLPRRGQQSRAEPASVWRTGRSSWLGTGRQLACRRTQQDRREGLTRCRRADTGEEMWRRSKLDQPSRERSQRRNSLFEAAQMLEATVLCKYFAASRCINL